MKKTLLFIAVLLVFIAALPFIGNKLVEESLETQIQSLNKHGIKLEQSSVNRSYLHTKRDYTFLVEDVDKFLVYLSKYSKYQVPSTLNAIAEGVKIGADLEYSNIPFTKAIKLDIYLLSLSKELNESLLQEDPGFYKYIKEFLQNKGFLHHIDYDIVSQDFNGYIKNIDESYTLQDKTKLILKLQNTTYSGNGTLLAPKIFISNIDTLILKATNNSEVLQASLEGFSSIANFDSLSEYATEAKVQNIEINSTNIDEVIMMNLENLFFQVHSKENNTTVQVNTKNSLENLYFNSSDVTLQANKLNYDLTFDEMDRRSLKELSYLVSKISKRDISVLSDEIYESAVDLLAHGMIIKVNDISMNKLEVDGENLDGLKMQAQTRFKEDENLATLIYFSPLLGLKNLDTNIKLKLSKKIFQRFTQNFPMLTFVRPYAKEENKNLIYEIVLSDQEFKINGKGL